MHSRKIVLLCVLVLLISTVTAQAKRCATSLRDNRPTIIHTPTAYRVPYRAPVPLPTTGANVYNTDHFRVLWGEAYDHADPDWADADGNGTPAWVEVLGDTLERSYGILVNMGFSPPYGVEQYYIDAYVANTGIVVEGRSITLSTDFYGYTDIDKQYSVAYFIFNNDFSIHTSDELEVLKATAVHELFHAVQRVDYPWDDEVAIPDPRWNEEKWWFEATATWLEEIIEPDVNDHIQYIKRFLEHPAGSLTYADGEREYGASIFPGYIWYRNGGAASWQEIMVDVNSLGVEQAIDRYLTGQGTSFLETVTAFWSMAGHPEDLWPDGAQFYPAEMNNLYQQVNQLPVELQPASTNGPERLGADLFRITDDAAAISLTVVQSTSPSSLHQGASQSGSSDVITEAVQPGIPLVIDTPGEKDTYMAIVNTSSAGDSPGYLARISKKSIIPADIDANGVINLADLLLTLKISTGHDVYVPDPEGGDINNDETAGIVEAVYIIQLLAESP
jgi:hypothetical protein